MLLPQAMSQSQSLKLTASKEAVKTSVASSMQVSSMVPPAVSQAETRSVQVVWMSMQVS